MLELRNIEKVVGEEHHIHPTSLVLERGTLNVLLGPTLSGKTSLMRLMAGLDVPTAGSIHFDGQDVTGVRVQDRHVAMVYQQFINYPAMTVYENIASPMRVAGKDKATIDREVRKAAELLKLTPYLDRTPLNLSGGQQQRVALARMIAPRPNIMLLDEPLSNLDATLRVEMRLELLKLHRATGATSVYVTHDQVEAMTMASHVAVLNHGRIEQFDTPENLLANPASAFVAGFVGTPPANLLAVERGKWLGTLDDPGLRGHTGKAMVRAEELTIHTTPGARRIATTLVEIVPMAGRRLVTGLTQGGQRLTAIADAHAPLGESLHFELPRLPSALFGPDGARAP